jgi:uncharacterized lipoprotein YbaY
MKKLMKRSLVMIALSAILLAYSKDAVSATNEPINKKARVEFEQVQKGSLLSIKDENGTIIYKEKIKNSGTFLRMFDFRELPQANYYFEIDGESEIRIIPFKVNENDTQLTENASYSIPKPQIKVEENLVFVSSQSAIKQNMDVKVFYEGNKLAFEESLTDSETVKRTYDFSNSLAGDYTIVLTTQGRSFVDHIRLP